MSYKLTERVRVRCQRCGCKYAYLSSAWGDKRPMYTCANCGHIWTRGLKGEHDAGAERSGE
jgi:uncharacterized Zn finger protein